VTFISVPEKPATRINENEDDVDDCDAGNAFSHAEYGPEYAADNTEEKSDSFFAADEPEAGYDKGSSAPVHVITPFQSFSPTRRVSGGGDAFLDSQSSGGFWGGAWTVGIGPTGEPARNSSFRSYYTGQMSSGQSRKCPKDAGWRKIALLTGLFFLKNIFSNFSRPKS